MIRRLVNRSFDLLFAKALAPLANRRLRGRILCLIYHRVCDEQVGYLEWGGVPTISTRELRHDMAYLKQCGSKFLTFRDLRDGKMPSPNVPNFIISFDDGFRDTYEQGLPVLEYFGIPSVVFQVSELIDAQDLNWEHTLYRYACNPETRDMLLSGLDSMGSLPGPAAHKVKTARDTVPTQHLMTLLEDMKHRVGDHAQRRELARRLYPDPGEITRAVENGHEVGSHGSRHIARRFLSSDQFSEELEKSSRRITEILSEAPRAFAYPFGSHKPGDTVALSKVYDQAVLACPGYVEPRMSYSIPRCPWPGPARNELRRRRWLLTGRV